MNVIARRANIHDRYRERLTAINAALNNCRIVIRPYTDDYHYVAVKPFALYSRLGAYIARYLTLDAAEQAARRYEGNAR